MSATGTPKFAVNRLMSTARKLSPRWCSGAALACTRCDYALKTSSGDRSALLEALILSLCTGKEEA